MQERKQRTQSAIVAARNQQPAIDVERDSAIAAAYVGPPAKSLADVGRLFGISRQRVCFILDRQGIDRRTRDETMRLQRLDSQ